MSEPSPLPKEVLPEQVEKYLSEHPNFIDEWLSKSKSEENAAFIRKPPRFSSYVEKVMMKQKREKRQLISSLVSENELFSELVKDITHEININALSHKILQNIIKLTHCERGSLFFVEVVGQQKVLVSNLFDVTQTSAVGEAVREDENVIRIPIGKGIAGYVAETKEKVNISDAYKDPRFNKEIDEMTGCRTKCLVCMPILNYCDEVIGVAQIINKLDADYFTENDEKTFKDYLYFCGISLNNAQLFAKSVEEYKRNQQLLNLVGDICAEYSNFMSLIEVILGRAKEILDCNYVCLGLLTPSKKEDANEKELNLYEMQNESLQTNVSHPIYRKLANDFIQNKDRLFMYDVVKDKLFLKETSNVLHTNYIGAIALLDTSEDKNGCIFFTKDSTDFFNESNFTTMETFGLFCGLGIHNCQICWSTIRCLAQQQISHEILSFHTTADDREVNRFMLMEKRTVSEYGIYNFSFSDIGYSDDTTVIIAALIFLEVNALYLLDIELHLLYKWILTVKKNYRPVVYHNWRHGLNVTQCFFCMLTTGGMRKYFSDFEIVVILVACLCHDLDHRGTNNDYELKSASKLATIYSSSTLEHHHFDHCIMILNNEKTNIFQNLPVNDYKKAVHLIEKAILSTDLSYYFQNRIVFQELSINQDTFEETEKRDLLLAIMITGSDLSGITKPWNIQRKVAMTVFTEFYQLGDLQKNELKTDVIAIFDREKKSEIPKLQVGFIDFVCKPVFELLQSLSPDLTPLLNGCIENRKHWKNIIDGKEEFNIDTELERALTKILTLQTEEEVEGRLASRISEVNNEEQSEAKSLTGGHNFMYQFLNNSNESSESLGSSDQGQYDYCACTASPTTSQFLLGTSYESSFGGEKEEAVKPSGSAEETEKEKILRIKGNKENKIQITGGHDVTKRFYYKQRSNPMGKRKEPVKTYMNGIIEEKKLQRGKENVTQEFVEKSEVSQNIERSSFNVIPPDSKLVKNSSSQATIPPNGCLFVNPTSVDSIVRAMRSSGNVNVFLERKRRCMYKARTDTHNNKIEKSVVCVIA